MAERRWIDNRMVASALDNITLLNKPCFLSCDWGTSSFRLRLVTRETGRVLTHITDNSGGIRTIYNRWTNYTGSLSRVDFYLSFLNDKIIALEEKTSTDMRPLPIALSGMASSNIGIMELPYSLLPVKMDDPNLNIEVIEATDQFPRDLYLISGVRSSDDVMRGEETQLLGLSSKLNIRDGICLLTGTHSKHAWLKGNTITAFKTYMTGELFDLISSKSILSSSVTDNKDPLAGQAFEEGVEASQKENLLHSLFKIRARDLINAPPKTGNYSFLSGLLIGTELKELASAKQDPIILWGSSRLQRYYAAALDVLGLDFVQPDIKKHEDITSLGQRRIIEQINY